MYGTDPGAPTSRGANRGANTAVAGGRWPSFVSCKSLKDNGRRWWASAVIAYQACALTT
jgi:hypothetical protein